MKKSVMIFLVGCLAQLSVAADVPDCVRTQVAEMRKTGGSVCGGVMEDGSVFFVAIGLADYRPENINDCRETAKIRATQNLASALNTSVKSHDVTAIEMTQVGERTEVKAFVSSMTERSVDQVLKGVQIVSAEPNGRGEMEVVIYAASEMADQSAALAEAQLQWGDKGVVRGVGIDADRQVAEQNALRSAVEQVAGTLVIGKVSINERDELHKRLATTSGALVQEYRVVDATVVEAQYHVAIIARVDKRKLYDDYRSYFKCLDNPTFCLVATDEALIDQFSGFFLDKGFSLTQDPEQCTYLVKLNGRFRDRPTPGNPNSVGTMLELNIKIVSQDGSKVLLEMNNDPKAKDSEVLSPEQRRRAVARLAFNKLEPRLHQAVQDMVVRMLDDVDATPAAETFPGDAGTMF